MSAQEPALRLIHLSLQLDHYGDFPEAKVNDEAKQLKENAFSFRILRQLVVRHLAIFPVDFRLRQSMSSLLKLDYQKVKVPRVEQQILKK